jgi:hypothetical protein
MQEAAMPDMQSGEFTWTACQPHVASCKLIPAMDDITDLLGCIAHAECTTACDEYGNQWQNMIGGAAAVLAVCPWL